MGSWIGLASRGDVGMASDPTHTRQCRAEGLRQIHENVVQLRGTGGARQVPGEPRCAYSHVYGAPGISATTILTR